jgi:hypothetical protein
MDLAATTLEQHLENFTLRQLALWGMGILDPCCQMLRDSREPRTSREPGWLRLGATRRWKRAEAEYAWLIPASLSQFKKIIEDLAYAENLAGASRPDSELGPMFQGMDWLNPPLCYASHGIYIYVVCLEGIWGGLLRCIPGIKITTQHGSGKLGTWTHIRRDLRSFAEVAHLVAAARSLSESEGEAEAEHLARQILSVGIRNPSDPVGPPLSNELIARVLSGAKFFTGPDKGP